MGSRNACVVQRFERPAVPIFVPGFVDLRAAGELPGTLEWQSTRWKQMRDRRKKGADRMPCGGGAQVFGRHVQINLGTGDLAVPEQVPNRHQSHAGANQMRGEGVSHPVR